MLDTPPPKIEEQDCSSPSSMTSSRPIPPTSRNAFLCLETNSPAFFAASALFVAPFDAACVAGAVRRPVCGGILLLQLLFLPHPGDGITGRKLRILPQSLLVQRLRVGLNRRLLRVGYLPPGFQLAVRLPVLEFAVSVADSLFHAALRQVARLHADIFLLHLMYLRMGGVTDLL